MVIGMNKKRGMDLAIACIWGAIGGIALFYMEEGRIKTLILIISGILAFVFFLLAIGERGTEKGGRSPAFSRQSGPISELALLNEEGVQIMAWDMYGKVSMVIGRAGKNSLADVDLSQSPYGAMVDEEHGVLNFSGGNWYIEDLGSENGISIKKGQDGKTYRLSSDNPCIVEQGDQILVGMNRLLMK